jgi:hypothetical protein
MLCLSLVVLQQIRLPTFDVAAWQREAADARIAQAEAALAGLRVQQAREALNRQRAESAREAADIQAEAAERTLL